MKEKNNSSEKETSSKRTSQKINSLGDEVDQAIKEQIMANKTVYVETSIVSYLDSSPKQ